MTLVAIFLLRGVERSHMDVRMSDVNSAGIHRRNWSTWVQNEGILQPIAYRTGFTKFYYIFCWMHI